MQFQFRYETVKYTEKSFSLIINKNALGNLFQKDENNELNENQEIEVSADCVLFKEDFSNPNLQVLIEDVQLERVEERRIPMFPLGVGLAQNPFAMDDPNLGTQEFGMGKNQTENISMMESPYQRIYQNASRRYRKDETPGEQESNNIAEEEVMGEEAETKQNEEGKEKDPLKKDTEMEECEDKKTNQNNNWRNDKEEKREEKVNEEIKNGENQLIDNSVHLGS